MAAHRGRIVTNHIKLWPRAVFDLKPGKGSKGSDADTINGLLSGPGVYILYRDDQPYYVGKASQKLFHRLRRHASSPRDRYYNFWNFFSAFVIPNKKYIPEVEGILIASMPTDNSSVMRIKKIHLPRRVATLLRKQSLIREE